MSNDTCQTMTDLVNSPNGKASLSSAGNLLTNICHGVSSECGWWHHKATGTDLKKLISEPSSPEDAF